MRHVHKIASVNVEPLLLEIKRNHALWDQHTLRTDRYGTPHKNISDIWVRYNDYANFKGDLEAFNAEHDSVWYPCIEKLPSLKPIVFGIMSQVSGERLGGVLITRVPPGREVAPHIDHGWHADYYKKYAVQLEGDAAQVFQFENEEFRPRSGDVYWFENQVIHSVRNESDVDRMTLIVCIRS